MEDRDSQFNQQVRQVAIIGTGLLGGSIGLGLKAAGFKGRILGLGRRMETLERAQQRGCVDEISTSLVPGLRQSQLVILASPVATFEEWFTRLVPECHPKIVITDVGSTKSDVCAAAGRRLMGYAKRFVGAHPMAGSERHGPEHATADLFQGKPCVLTPLGDTDPDAMTIVEVLWSKLGMRLVRMLPRDHDWSAARISHLPHALAVALVRYVGGSGGMEIASTGFRDTTRVASGDPRVWLDIFSTNRAAVVEAIDQYTQELVNLRNLLEKGDDKRLLETLAQAQGTRDAWLKGLGEKNQDGHAEE